MIISISSSFIYATDRVTSENPSDAAAIRIGLSDRNSFSCQACMENGEFFNNGCKMCEQDGVVFLANVGKNNHYSLGWSNNNGMYHGDKECEGQINFEKLQSTQEDTLWVEITKTKLHLTSTIYSNPEFSDPIDFVSTEMCSNPTNIKYLRISNDDGKPAANGGIIKGNIDDIKISSIDNDHTYNEKLIFSTTFDECMNKSCEDKWILQNSKKNFVNTENGFFQFFAEVSGTNDYSHLKISEEGLDDSWILRFKFHISELELHPQGRGMLNLDPKLSQLVFGIMIVSLPIVGYLISRDQKSKILGILITISGLLIIFGTIVYSYYALVYSTTNLDNVIQLSFGNGLGIIIAILGIKKIKNQQS